MVISTSNLVEVIIVGDATYDTFYVSRSNRLEVEVSVVVERYGHWGRWWIRYNNNAQNIAIRYSPNMLRHICNNCMLLIRLYTQVDLRSTIRD